MNTIINLTKGEVEFVETSKAKELLDRAIEDIKNGNTPDIIVNKKPIDEGYLVQVGHSSKKELKNNNFNKLNKVRKNDSLLKSIDELQLLLI